ncbi:UDP-N-acetylmuramate dehydrogenase [Mangrovibacterium diazotrophicum]|uniref:UDP-N-acetylenolpyruvoylglucosamine reductase n=1 Tax=Mangrovibacterium diazotrophicum TaxID=1261403 RepID=A0A419VUQ1_9BACT|nr:UDP-N-acetylmuramate dehydrogenase [Mangrovibacterium diazotrophicum]RKD85174.1 UDP-N-acetylmuramate dehydrogenase [Mangrovibacterium diazotrophicum]
MIRFEQNFSLKAYNTFGIEATARYFFEFTEFEDLPYFLANFQEWQKLPILLLGGGSNMLFVDDFDGVVIHSNIPGIKQVNEDRNHVWLEVGAGENWDRFVAYCVSEWHGGVENLSLIPGNVGAAPVQNIGAYGVEVCDYIESVKGFDLKTFEAYDIPAAECRFGYRDSVFKHELKNRFIVTSVVFRLDKFIEYKLDYGDLRAEVEKRGGENIHFVRDAVIAIRESKLPDPEVLGNAGSFFKNPIVESDFAEKLKKQFPQIPVYPAGEGKNKLAAGWLIDQCGLKGYRVGDAAVHEKQALVLVNHGAATGNEIYELAKHIQNSVHERFQVALEPEVNMIGI